MFLIIEGDYHLAMDRRYVDYDLVFVGRGYRVYRGVISEELLVEADRCSRGADKRNQQETEGAFYAKTTVMFAGREAEIFLLLSSEGKSIRLFFNLALLALSRRLSCLGHWSRVRDLQSVTLKMSQCIDSNVLSLIKL